MGKVEKPGAAEVAQYDVREIMDLHPEWLIEVEHKRWYLVGKNVWMLLTKGDAWRIHAFNKEHIDPTQPDTFGGFTSVKVYTPARVFKAISRCSIADGYNKKKGRKEAIDKLIGLGLEI